MRRKHGFSLIELLVVVSIIVLLVSITMPSFREVRRVSRKTVCKKNLATIGLGIHAYLLTHRDTFPWGCALPSYEAIAAADQGRAPYIPLTTALKNEMSGKSEVYLCPADKNTLMQLDPLSPADHYVPTDRYFDNEDLSYEWETRLNGLHLSFKEMEYIPAVLKFKPSEYRMLADFEPFHGGSAKLGSWNVLYVDLHVQSDKRSANPPATGLNPNP